MQYILNLKIIIFIIIVMKINIDIINNTLTKNIENKMIKLKTSDSIPCTVNQCGWKMNLLEIKMLN